MPGNFGVSASLLMKAVLPSRDWLPLGKLRVMKINLYS